MMVKIYYIYFMITTLSVYSITVTSFQAFAVEEIWEDYETMGEMVKDIRNGDKDDDNVDYNKFKDSVVYKNAKEDVRNCIDLANKVGEKLGDYEIVRCFENTNYFEEKYVDDEGQNTEEVNLQDSDNQNMTRSNDVSDADRQQQQHARLSQSDAHGIRSRPAAERRSRRRTCRGRRPGSRTGWRRRSPGARHRPPRVDPAVAASREGLGVGDGGGRTSRGRGVGAAMARGGRDR